jgi:hypothetical protein
VRYGPSPDRLERAVAATEVRRHFPGVRDWLADLGGLHPDTKYFYAIEANRATLCGADQRHWFRTAPAAVTPRTLRLWLLGGSGSNRPRDDDLAQVLVQDGPIRVRNGFRHFNRGRPLDGIILLGDNAYPSGTDEQYQAALFNVYTDELLCTPLWPCIGNHDMDDAFQEIFTVNSRGRAGGRPSESKTYYSADLANLHLVLLDPWKEWLEKTPDEDYPPWRRPLAWLDKDLATTERQWVVVVNHFPLYYDGNYDSDTNGPLRSLRERLVPILDRYSVDLFLAGHDHTYQRSYLLRGLTGTRDTYDPSQHRRWEGDGRATAIVKRPGPESGTLYIVSGTGGGTRPNGSFTHPALVPFSTATGQRRGLAVPGSLVIEVEGRTLRGWQVDAQGEILDHFTLWHAADRAVPPDRPSPR